MTLSTWDKSAEHSQRQFHGKRQGVDSGDPNYLWWFSFFCAAEKPEKWGELYKK
jgi:hypothetical protein